MLIGIISDTHDRLARTKAAVRLLQAEGIEALFHCGDYCDADIIRACAGVPGYFVYGNNDADNTPALREAVVEIDGTCLEWAGEVAVAGKRIAIAHGHMSSDVRRLLAARPDYFLYGHSHLPADERAGPTRKINPGALHRAAEYTVAVLDLKTDELRYLTVAP